MNNAAAQDAQIAQARFVGTGDAETTKYQWLSNQHRDTYASLIGHPNLLSYMAVAENESLARCRLNLLEKMVQPCGPPPPAEDA
ncbi:Splicing factor 3B subunit 5 [Dimargaris cristalligena]|uniref:Splicing factor subunit n=1 Tax=Dimargaris cristalligena TaxID=215637 RepID=A0A4P9ZZR0_9FUNG|nr:Splicing factor 3B subunit 5 [Dimargaris cristalligena]RKP39225.1 splicing factor 3B subunit 5/RDS3 complex subunit 10 [Dimargaris cristalligena]|eukprot:RKP39225.1 splicing factor 3B subunit 5/RDS3 complex subunit 10 [Dimargaris cristalligena]